MAAVPGLILRTLIGVANHWPWAARKVNTFGINKLVNACRARPHPWSTAHDYISWTSLTDQEWSARHLPPVALPADLPDTQDLVALFARDRGAEQKLCDKSTVLFPAFAQYLTDGFIRTRMPVGTETDDVRRKNTSNHQIDLCPLYGRTPTQTAALRVPSDAVDSRGQLKSQIINGEEYAPYLYHDDGKVKAEFTALDEPLGISKFPDPELRAHIFAFGGDRTNTVPQVAMINTLLLREHNRLAREIAEAHSHWDDERVFETTRNVVIFIFIKIVVEEYINHISSAPFRLSADPSVAWDAPWNKPNWITTEFSLLYRWHSLVPDEIEWNGTRVPVEQTFMDNRQLIAGGLCKSFVSMSSQRAGRLGPFNTTESLLQLEVAAVDQGRRVRLASYADYREFVGMSRPKEFTDISSDSAVVRFLESSYRHPDDVDFYIGLFAEDRVKNSPLPPLLLSMVAVDAFSQALTNPLLSKHVLKDKVATFSREGWEAIEGTSSLRDILDRNCPGGVGANRISMTQEGWAYAW
ncbi:MAG: heme peroxidase [Actinobacteria bacterium]|nr:heme peroxidase [Actinomycetota bacterium]